MRSSSSFRRALATATVLATLAGIDAGAQPLFEPVAVSGAAPAQRDGERSRTVRPRLDVLAATFSGVADTTLTLNLFDDVVLEVTRLRLDDATASFRTWVGTSQADDTVFASLTTGAAGLSGSATAGGVSYTLHPAGDGAVVIRERPRAEAGPELPARLPPDADGPASLPVVAAADGHHSSADVLVLYTAAARLQQGGDIRAVLANAVAVTNAAFQRSGVDASLVTADLQEVAFGELAEGIVADLTALSAGGAHFASVDALRRTAGADLVALVVGRASPSAGCGVAYLGPSPSAIFSVTEAACLTPGQWSFTHEIGHNFGADHAPGDPIVSPVEYARGFRDAAVRTLMAYPAAGSPPRSLNYSSRVVREPAGTGVPTGNAAQDNARRLHETAATVSAFTPSRFAPAAPVDIEATVSGDSVTVRWTAAPHGGPVTRYGLEAGTAPGIAAFGPFVTTDLFLVFTGVSPDRYFVRLRSQGPGGISADSVETIVDVPCLVPGPGAIAASMTGALVTLQWSAPPGAGATRYEVGVGTTPAATEIGVFATGTVQQASLPAPAGTYYVRVRGVNGCGPGGVSPAVRVIVP